MAPPSTMPIAASVMLLLLAITFSSASASHRFWPRKQPYVIGHRGASGYLPEHTLESYKLAADMGADFVECDVVLTKDLVPICRHEPVLSGAGGTTDASDKFPQLVRSIIVDGANFTGVFSTDLTLAEVKTLRAKERLDFRNQSSNFLFQIPTLEEQIKFAKTYSRTLGIYPETKHPTWHDSLPILKEAGTTMTEIVVKLLHKYGYTGPVNSKDWVKQPVFLQSFEAQNLEFISSKTCIPLVQLMDDGSAAVPGEPAGTTYASLFTEKGLDRVAKYASGVGPWKQTLVSGWGAGTTQAPEGASLVSTGLLEKIQARGMQSHPYTWRAEPRYLTYGNFSSIAAEFDRYFAGLGIDGMFTDQTDTAVAYMKVKAKEAGRSWSQLVRLNAKPKPKRANPKSKCSK